MDKLISLQDAIKAIDEKAKRIKNEDTLNGLAGAVGILFDLPSVKPQEKTGQWIVQRRVGFGEWNNCIIPIEDGFVTNDCHCSMCGEAMSKGDRGVYCPNCGAKMVEEQERNEE